MTAREELCKLLFELSSDERMNILLHVQEQKSKLSEISRALDVTVTEASRHLDRLNRAGLVQREVDGSYRLTRFGELALSLLSGLEFISRNRDYFLEHETSCIPYEFIGRIGELAEGGLGIDTLRNLREVEVMFQNAQRYVWILSDQILASAGPIVEEKVKGGVECRVILPEKLVPPLGYKLLPSAANPQRKVLPKVEVVIVMTERVATFCLPTLRGRIDYTGFGGTGPKFHKWVKDLYLDYWQKAKPETIHA